MALCDAIEEVGELARAEIRGQEQPQEILVAEVDPPLRVVDQPVAESHPTVARQLVVATWLVTTRVVAPRNEAGLLEAPQLGVGAGFYALTLCNVLFLTTVWRYSALEAGSAIAPSAVAAVLIAPAAGGLVRARGPRVALGAGAVAYGGAVLALLLFAPAQPQLAFWLPVVVVAGTGIGLIFSSLAAQVSGLDSQQFSIGSAVGNASRQIGAVLGVAVLVAVIGTPTGIDAFRSGWIVTLAGVAISGLLAVVLPRQAHERGPSSPRRSDALETTHA